MHNLFLGKGNVLAIFLLFTLFSGISAWGQSGKKNVILIFMDDLTADPGATPKLELPNVDRLRKKGMNFASAHAASPLCNPSRTAILTGVAPWQSKIYDNSTFFRDDATYGSVTTLPQFFKGKGYEVISSGKIFHHSTGDESDPDSWTKNRTIVDVLYGDNASENGDIYTSNGGFLDKSVYEEQTNLKWGQIDKTREQMDDWKNVSEAISYLKSRVGSTIPAYKYEQLNDIDNPTESVSKADTTPFFLAVGIVRPHLPHYYPKDYASDYMSITDLPATTDSSGAPDTQDLVSPGNKVLDAMLSKYKEAGWKQAIQSYYRAARFADWCVGQLLDQVEKLPTEVKNNTLIVLMGDHGYHLGQKGSWAKANPNNATNPLLWEQTSHTPLIIYDPTKSKSFGKTFVSPVSLQDIYPTVLELCGFTLDSNFDNDPKHSKKIWGKSLASFLTNGSTSSTSTYAQSSGFGGWYSLRTNEWRLLYKENLKGTREQTELYCHSANYASKGIPEDGGEMDNLLYELKETDPNYTFLNSIVKSLYDQSKAIRNGTR
jgi:arylsulfatase A-like enzyme